MSKIRSALGHRTPEVEREALYELTRRVYRQDLFLTCKHLLGYSDITEHTHREMIAALEAPTKRKLIVMPRGTFKSSIGVVGYSIWRLLNNPNERILVDSEVFNNSKNFLREIKAHLQSPLIVKLFGEFKSDVVWNEGEIVIQQRTKPFKEASVTCGGIGTVKVGQHFSTIIGDDLNSGNNSESVEGRKKVLTHYKMNIAILEPQGTYVIIGTRYATDDVIGHILENEVEDRGLLEQT